jgi:hypothetical protein
MRSALLPRRRGALLALHGGEQGAGAMLLKPTQALTALDRATATLSVKGIQGLMVGT